MAWKIEYRDHALRQLGRLDRQWQRRIVDYMDMEIAGLEDPTTRGHALSSNLSGLWRFRVGDYRVICEVLDESLIILVVAIGHRSTVYR